MRPADGYVRPVIQLCLFALNHVRRPSTGLFVRSSAVESAGEPNGGHWPDAVPAESIGAALDRLLLRPDGLLSKGIDVADGASRLPSLLLARSAPLTAPALRCLGLTSQRFAWSASLNVTFCIISSSGGWRDAFRRGRDSQSSPGASSQQCSCGLALKWRETIPGMRVDRRNCFSGARPPIRPLLLLKPEFAKESKVCAGMELHHQNSSAPAPERVLGRFCNSL